jgi:hypothetical protein
MFLTYYENIWINLKWIQQVWNTQKRFLNNTTNLFYYLKYLKWSSNDIFIFKNSFFWYSIICFWGIRILKNLCQIVNCDLKNIPVIYILKDSILGPNGSFTYFGPMLANFIFYKNLLHIPIPFCFFNLKELLILVQVFKRNQYKLWFGS